MKRYLWFLLAIPVIAVVAYRVHANTVVNQAVSRFTGIAVDNTANGRGDAPNGKNIYGIYFATISLSSATTGTTTIAGASSAAHVWATKKDATSATYVKAASMSSAGNVLVTMSGSTSSDIEILAIDYGPVTY